MRFAYIDSQGKEVGIPTVEALQLRIELGAITEETIFYDASKDRWDPAGEHEIFRTLSREIRERGDEGPRPPTPKVTSSGEGESEVRRGKAGAGEAGDDVEDLADVEDPQHEVGSSRRRAPDPFDKEQDPPSDPADAGEGGTEGLELELDDVGEPTGEASPSPPDAGGDWDVDLGDFGSLELAPELEDADEPTEDDVASDEPAEATAETETAEASAERKSGGPGEEDEEDSASDVEGPGGDLELERSFAEQHGSGSGVTPESDVDLEPPLSESAAESTGSPPPEPPPHRAPDPDPDPAHEVGERVPARSAEGAVLKGRARKDPYDRRAQPPQGDGPPRRRSRPRSRRRKGRPSGRIAAVVGAVVLLGAGGWFGWSALGGSGAGGSADDAVAVPPLPADVEAAAREIAASAWDESLDSLRAMAAGAELPEEPNPDWLAGVYLANAGDYPDVLAYWEALEDHLDRVRSADEPLFVTAFASRLEASDLPAESRDTVTAWARAGFRAAAAGRQVAYGQLEALIDAATDLHRFLVGNEANITYEPAEGMSRNPVTEAIPSNPALGDEMQDRVGEIPDALEALGALDRVTTERILEVFYRRLASVSIG